MSEDLRLYILVRTDMASMASSRGRMAAQASHASAQFVLHHKDDVNCQEWQAQANGFGTTIVLAVNEWEMRCAVADAQADGIIADVVNDPTYPIADGEVVHLVSVDTCAYLFGDRRVLDPYTAHFPLA